MPDHKSRLEDLKEKIIDFFTIYNRRDLEKELRRFDLRPPLELDASNYTKKSYAEAALANLPETELIALAHRMLADFQTSSDIRAIEDRLWWIEPGGPQQISASTRLEIAEALEGRQMNPRTNPQDWVESNTGWKHSNYSEKYRYGENSSVYVQDTQKFISRSSSHMELLKLAGLLGWPDQRVLRFLESMVDPHVRDGKDQKEWVDLFNSLLSPSGFILEATEPGGSNFRARSTAPEARKRIDNIIFAAKYKPQIGLDDALENRLKIWKNKDACLIYDEDIPANGLTWLTLVNWWARTQFQNDEEARKSLDERLQETLASEPEKLLFRTYYTQVKAQFGDRLPALLPQVYVYYDPRKKEDRTPGTELPVQRMDFLMIMPSQRPVVIEVDGVQHYAEEKVITGETNKRWIASPSIYSKTVGADRELRLKDYHVFRFGGYELQQDQGGVRLVEDFMVKLFKKFGVS